ncbi:aspartate carbamoyltransferase catalytic subunit [uncultured Tyzzerella sp.]|uniref:aspartate carbamoyltransferase catalytic subunit n=1 Tax=uncultured Tyzzerella sp. TaxID=2321398 RepID=UPI002943F865|nr:aspartate carbamoyltransferase catalytic subunit [uncultured Tyzzerella sp.]
MIFKRKDFISLMDISAEEILHILDTAETMKHVIGKKNKKSPYLEGKSVIVLFYERSVRAKLSYELAAQYLSANIVDIVVSETNNRYENLHEMGRTIDQMGADFIICRHPMSGSAKFIAENVNASVINAGDGINENPSQALLDLMTIKNTKGGFKGLKVAIIGDVESSRVTRSNIWGLLKLGADVCVSGPPTMIPRHFEKFGVKVYYDPKEAVKDADVIMTLRLQDEKSYGSKLASFNEYKSFFKLDETLLSYASKDAIVMHPGMPHKSIEISTSILESTRVLMDDQITNGVAVRMALLYLLSLGMGV